MEPEDTSKNYAKFVRKLSRDHAAKRILGEPLIVEDIEDEETVRYFPSDSLVTGLSSVTVERVYPHSSTPIMQ
jgi:hypothetical protein